MPEPEAPVRGYHDALAALRWHVDVGADALVQETPRNWFADPPGATAAAGAARPMQRPTFAPDRPTAARTDAPDQSEADAIVDGEALARSATDLDDLKAKLTAFDGCALKLRATQVVFADGNPAADIMLIGEAPGRDEDIEGRPFVGRSGQLLDRMLGAIGLDRTKVYIANTVPWRPPGNRTPTQAEILTCRPFLNRQIELVAPKLIVTLGAAATQTMRDDPKLSIVRQRGKWTDITIAGTTYPTMAMFHPAFLLRQPHQKREAWVDLLALQTRMKAL